MKEKNNGLFRFFSAFLSLTMLFSFFACTPFTVSAEETGDFTYKTYDDGTCAITGFSGKYSSVIIPQKLGGYEVIGILEGSFKDNLNITQLSMSENVEFINDNAFSGCKNLSAIKLSRNIYKIGKDVFTDTAYFNNSGNWDDGMLYVSSGYNYFLIAVNKQRENYVIKDGTTVIADYTFSNNKKIRTCKFPDTLMTIGNRAFYNCSVYNEEITFPDYLLYIGDQAFYCTAIKKLVFPDNVAYIGTRAFENTKVTEVILPKNLEVIPASVFYDCRKLEKIEIPNKVKYISTCAFAFSGLKEITIPESVEYIGPGAFNGTNMSKIKLPDKYIEIYTDAFYQTPYYWDESNWVNDGLYLGNYLLYSRFDINVLNIKNGTKYVAAEICEGNNGLVSVTIPESVEYIGSFAFLDCGKLNSVSIPATVKHIGTYAFGVIEYGDKYYLKDPFRIVCIKDSAAYKYAKNLNIKIVEGSKANSVSLNRSTLTLGVGEAYTLIKTVTPGIAGSACKWSSNNTAVATVNSNGTVTAKKAGTAKITVKTSNGLSKSCTVTVKAAPSSIKVSTNNLTLGIGEEYIISESTNAGSYAWKFGWSSSDTKVATVTKRSGNKAKIVAKGTGTAYITVKTYNGKSATCKVNVKSAPTSVTLSNSNIILGKGETFIISQNSNSGSYAKSFTWSSSNSNVATIEKTSGNKAKITAKTNGTATITFKTFNGITATCKVTVKNAPTSVKTNPASVTLGVGETYTISESTNSGTYANAENLKWSSTNTSVATVIKGSGNKAQIVAKGVGTAYVKITLYNGKTAQCKVTVKPAPTSVKLNVSEIMLKTGDEFVIAESTNSGSYANSTNLKWESSDSNIASVTKLDANKAKVTAKGTGVATLKLTTYNSKVSFCTVYVNTTKADVPEDDVQVESSPIIIDDETEIIKETVLTETE